MRASKCLGFVHVAAGDVQFQLGQVPSRRGFAGGLRLLPRFPQISTNALCGSRSAAIIR